MATLKTSTSSPVRRAACCFGLRPPSQTSACLQLWLSIGEAASAPLLPRLQLLAPPSPSSPSWVSLQGAQKTQRSRLPPRSGPPSLFLMDFSLPPLHLMNIEVPPEPYPLPRLRELCSSPDFSYLVKHVNVSQCVSPASANHSSSCSVCKPPPDTACLPKPMSLSGSPS